MSRDEVKQILMRIQVTYPNWKPQGDLALVVDVWHEYLSRYTYEEILGAVKAYVMSDTSGFAPSVGQILGKLRAVTEPEGMGGLEAWALVSKALRNGNYGAEEEFGKLPPMVQKAVGSPENIRNWAFAEEKTVETVIMSQFLSSYKAVQKRSEELAKIPEGLRIGIREGLAIADNAHQK